MNKEIIAAMASLALSHGIDIGPLGRGGGNYRGHDFSNATFGPCGPEKPMSKRKRRRLAGKIKGKTNNS